MSARAQVVVLAGVITALTLVALAGSSRLSGPVLLEVSADHGLHLDDLAVLGGWAWAMWWCLRQWRRSP